MNKYFSFDAETNGLWGQAFAIAAVCEDGSKFIGRCPIEGDVNPWVRDNVLPQMEGIKITHSDYKSLLSDFMKFYLQKKEDRTILVHMGLPVEAKLFLDAHEMGIIGDWDAPYPLVDISAIPEINTSVDSYNKNLGIEVPEMEGGTHNPLYDSYATMMAYDYYMSHR